MSTPKVRSTQIALSTNMSSNTSPLLSQLPSRQSVQSVLDEVEENFRKLEETYDLGIKRLKEVSRDPEILLH